MRRCAFIVEGLHSSEQDRAWPLASESRPSAATDIVENRWQHRAAWSKDSVAAENHAGAHAGQRARLHILIAEDSEHPVCWLIIENWMYDVVKPSQANLAWLDMTEGVSTLSALESME